MPSTAIVVPHTPVVGPVAGLFRRKPTVVRQVMTRARPVEAGRIGHGSEEGPGGARRIIAVGVGVVVGVV
jgi:hypothetical protein